MFRIWFSIAVAAVALAAVGAAQADRGVRPAEPAGKYMTGVVKQKLGNEYDLAWQSLYPRASAGRLARGLRRLREPHARGGHARRDQGAAHLRRADPRRGRAAQADDARRPRARRGRVAAVPRSSRSRSTQTFHAIAVNRQWKWILSPTSTRTTARRAAPTREPRPLGSGSALPDARRLQLKNEILRKHVEPCAEFTTATELAERLLENIELVVRGKRDEVSLVLCALFCRGHVLLEDVPGTAKTVLARAIATSIDGRAPSRVQCTPDLQPTDLTGLSIYNQKEREFEFQAGPIFAGVVLVDEINRAMPRTQSALLEAMAERQITVDGESHPLPDPFLILATQNPLDHEGTFPLPEAQLDRFFLKTTLGYPDLDDELRIVQAQLHGHPLDSLGPVDRRRRPALDPGRGRGASTSTRSSSAG